MKIGVCFKIVPDYEEIPAEEWENMEQLDFTYVKKMYGCFDESALETALRLKDSYKNAGQEVEAVAVTAGVSSGSVSEALLRGLFAAGFDDVVMLPETEHFNPSAASKHIASYFKSNPADIIFTGRMVGPGDSGMFPFYLAKEIGYDVISELTEASYNNMEKRAEVICKDETSMKTFALDGKCVCTVGDAAFPNLRLFPLKARMEAKKRVFSHFGDEDENINRENENAGMILRAEKNEESHCSWIEDKSQEETAQFLIDMLNGEAK